MIELYLKKQVKKLDLISEIETDAEDLFNILIIDFTDSELTEVSEKLNRYVIFNQKKDIEISSHYLNRMASSFNFSHPIIIGYPFKEEEYL
jgi:magnesium transporter